MALSVLGFTIPTLGEIVERVLDDLQIELPNEDVRIKRTEPFAFGTALGGAVSGVYGFVLFLAGQVLPDRATGTYLTRHASIDGIYRLQPTYSKGSIRATGNIGFVIPAGTRWQLLSDGSVEWEQAADFTIGGSGYVDVNVTALIAGPAGDAPASTLVQLSDEIAGIDLGGVVQTDIDGGDNLESDDSLRRRLLDKKQSTPEGGADADYVAWVKLIGGVNQVYVSPNEFGNGTVGIRFTMDVPFGGDSADAIPSTQDVSDAQDSVDANKPVTADAQVVAISAEGHTFDISIVPNESDVQDAAEAEINALFLRSARPGGLITLGELRGAIDSAAGEESHVINLIDGFAPVESAIPIGGDSWPTITSITWS